MNRLAHTYINIILSLLLTACSSSDRQTESELKKQNQLGEYIYRKSDESFFALNTPKPKEQPPYPWEKAQKSGLRKITKDYFRCNGSSLNPERVIQEGNEIKRYTDCGGNDKHGLPMENGKEFVYPILIDLLNDIQQKTGKRVIITSGHRCPEHNLYVDPSKENQYSKHMIGAEVSFYVQGYEEKPQQIVELIKDYYHNTPAYKNNLAYQQFQRYTKDNTNVRTEPWLNKEIFIKIFQKDEGRNFDNRHPYPYISLQVRYDKEKNEPVTYSWPKAYKNYLRK